MSLTKSFFDKICRICLEQEMNLTSILQTDILKMFHTCTTIKIENDELPKNICSLCLNRINNAFAFNQLCVQSDYTLRQILEYDDKSWFLSQNNSEENNVHVKSEPNDSQESQDMVFNENKPYITLNDLTTNKTSNTKKQKSKERIVRKSKRIKKSVEKNPVRIRVKIEPSSYKCETCSEEFPDVPKLVKHTLAKHEVKPVKCQDCNKIFTLKVELNLHMQNVHSTFTCTDCNKTFPKAYKLKKHRIVHNEDRPFICGKCPKSFKYADVLRKHEFRAHSERVRQKCEICEKEVMDLKTHQEVAHSTEKPFQCEKCAKYFPTELILKRHIIYTHDKLYSKKSFLCNICGAACQTRRDLEGHIRVHTGEKPYKCDLCDKAFRFKHSLRSHKVMHTDVRPFVCQICYKGFKLNKRLKQHLTIHADLRPHVCSVCSKAFNQSSTLKRHMETHSNYHNEILT